MAGLRVWIAHNLTLVLAAGSMLGLLAVLAARSFVSGVFGAAGKWVAEKWLGRHAEPRQGISGFPFDVAGSADAAARLAPNFMEGDWDCPYTARLPDHEQGHFEEGLDGSRCLLISGRTGLGKTREPLEVVRRLEKRKGRPVTVLFPQAGLVMPPFVWPTDLPNETVVLFLDNLHQHYVPDVGAREGLETGSSYREWLPGAVEKLGERVLGADFRVIALVRDDLDGVDWQRLIRVSAKRPLLGEV